MKNSLILAALLLMSGQVLFAQKTEWYGILNSGLFSFRGPSAASTTQMLYSSDAGPLLDHVRGAAAQDYTGQKPGLSFGFSGQVQRVTKGNFLVGMDLGYDNLRSKVSVNRFVWYYSKAIIQEPARGKVMLSNHFFNARPYIGYRVAIGQLSLDLTAGADVAYLLESRENGRAETESGRTVTSSRERRFGARFDPRPRLQVAALYRGVGLYAGYSRGFANYYRGLACGPPDLRSELIRFGILYKVKG